MLFERKNHAAPGSPVSRDAAVAALMKSKISTRRRLGKRRRRRFPVRAATAPQPGGDRGDVPDAATLEARPLKGSHAKYEEEFSRLGDDEHAPATARSSSSSGSQGCRTCRAAAARAARRDRAGAGRAATRRAPEQPAALAAAERGALVARGLCSRVLGWGNARAAARAADRRVRGVLQAGEHAVWAAVRAGRGLLQDWVRPLAGRAQHYHQACAGAAAGLFAKGPRRGDDLPARTRRNTHARTQQPHSLHLLPLVFTDRLSLSLFHFYSPQAKGQVDAEQAEREHKGNAIAGLHQASDLLEAAG